MSQSEDTYEVLNLIGKGSFGEIRRVRRYRDGAILCRKEIWWKKMNQKERDQLASEIRILRELQHKNIVQYITQTVDQETSMVYIYMEYCGNGDLHDLIQTRKQTSPRIHFGEHTVWQIFSQLVLALYRCHNGVNPPPLEDVTNPSTLGTAQSPSPRLQSIVLHRDVKPQNVFLDHNNRVKLGDFGLSKEVTGHNLADTYVGTPFYMSPEIIAGRTYNSKSDIWALGCVIYEMCAFEPPFVASGLVELNKKIKYSTASSITRFGYSDALNNTVQSCLRQDERLRPSAAGLLKRPEIVLARQQASYLDREEVLIEKETAVIAREKEIERAVMQKWQEFQLREESLAKREQRLHRLETHHDNVLQDSAQRKLLEAQHMMEIMAEEKSSLEHQIAQLRAQLGNGTQSHSREPYPDLQQRSDAADDAMMILDSAYNEMVLPKRSARPIASRAHTEVSTKLHQDDPLNLMPKPSNTQTRSEATNRTVRSPQRRKSNIPMSRIRPDPPTREALSEQFGVQGLARALSKQDLCRIPTGTENTRPTSANGFSDRNTLMRPRTPIKETSTRILSTPRRMAWPSPTRATVRTLFANEPIGLKRENQRPAPTAPSTKIGNLLEGMQKAKINREARQLDTPLYIEDDLPSPYIKKTYVSKPIHNQ